MEGINDFDQADGRHIIHLFKRKLEKCDLLNPGDNLSLANKTHMKLKSNETLTEDKFNSTGDDVDMNSILQADNETVVLLGDVFNLKQFITQENIRSELNVLCGLLQEQNSQNFTFECEKSCLDQLKGFQYYFLTENVKVIVYDNLFKRDQEDKKVNIIVKAPMSVQEGTIFDLLKDNFGLAPTLTGCRVDRTYLPLRGFYNKLEELNQNEGTKLFYFPTNLVRNELKYVTLEGELLSRLICELITQ